MKTRIFLFALLIAGALVSCRNDKKDALTTLDIVKGKIQNSMDSELTPYDMIHRIRITLVTAPAELWVMDQNGTVIYQQDDKTVGKNIFKDDDYFSKFKDFQTACKSIAGAESGEVHYSYCSPGSTNTAEKTAFWTTLKVHDTSWKIIHTL